MKRMCMAMFVLCAHAALADFSSDTLAFYPFADKAVGETAETDDVITNAVSSSGTYDGTVQRIRKTAATGYGTLTFERFPYPYVYSDWSCTNLLTAEAQSIHMKSNGIDRSGAKILLNALAEKLYEDIDDKDYTIELFWRDNTTWKYETAFCYTGLDLYKFHYGYNNKLIRLNFTSTSLDYGTSIYDGLWHHLAVIYDHATKQITMVGDYSLVTQTPTDASTGSATSRIFVLGADDDNNAKEDIEFSCLRVTQRKLETSEFMVAYDAPVGNGNTVFHWGFDGANGSNIGTIADRSESGVDWDVMNTQYYFAHGAHSVRAGEIFAPGATADCTNPVYRVEMDRRKSVLMSGETFVSKVNLASGELLATANAAGVAKGYGFQWSTNRFLPVTGSFTVECLARLNADNWQHKVIDIVGSGRYRTTIMSRSLANGSGDWANVWGYGAFCVRADPDNTGNTKFYLTYTYYDGSHVPQKVLESVGWTMTNAEFDRTYHHFAVAYDPVALKLALFIDYEERASIDLPGPLALDASPCWQFGAGSNNGAFDGLYDEIRLSRGVLDVSEFLRMEKPELGFSIIFR